MKSTFQTFIIVFVALLASPLAAQNTLTLQQALKQAKGNNPYLKSAQFNAKIAQSDVVSAGLRPNIVFNNQSLQLIEGSKFVENSLWHNYLHRQVWTQLTKKVQLPSVRQAKIESAKKELLISEKNYIENERNLFLEVASQWLDVWAAQKQLEIMEDIKKDVDTLVVVQRLNYKNQIITKTDVFRAELLAKQYDLNYKQAKQTTENQQRKLQFLLGANVLIAANAENNVVFGISKNIDSLLAQALLVRGDMQVARASVEASEKNIRLQKALALPVPEFGFIFNPQNGVQYAGIFTTIELPIFSRNQGEKQKSHLLKQQAEQELINNQNKLQTEIKTAYANYQLQEENVEKFKEIVAQSATILENVRQGHLKGASTLVDFLIELRNYLEIQQQYYEVLHSYQQSYIDLLSATGLINQLTD